MPFSSLNNPQRWREHAEECRVLAEAMHDPEARNAMADVATAYDRLAEKIENPAAASCASRSPAVLSRS